MKHFAPWSIIGALILIVGALAVRIYSLQMPQFESDFSYNANVISEDNFYDESKGVFGGKVLSKTNFKFDVDEVNKNGLVISNSFKVRKPSGKEVFQVQRQYGINPVSGAHHPKLGDKSRSGYLFAPSNLKQKKFTYWHINYDQALTMNFEQVDTLYGLVVYKYNTKFVADQSENLTHLPGVPAQRGVNLDVELSLWVEPETGFLVSYEDHAVAWFYNTKTKKRIHPWNQFHNYYEELSISEHVGEAKIIKQRKRWYTQYFPMFLVLIAFTFLLIGFQYKQPLLWRLYLTIAMAGVICLSLSYLFYSSLRQNDLQGIQANFDRECEGVKAAMKSAIDRRMSYIYPLRSFVESGHEFSKPVFDAFVSKFVGENPDVIISWVPKISHTQRASFEQHLSEEHQINYFLKNRDLNCGMSVAETMPHYAPVAYVYPLQSNEKVLGFDLFSSLVRKNALTMSEHTREITSSKIIYLVKENMEVPSILLTLAAHDNERNCIGYIACPITIKEIFEYASIQSSIDPNLEVTMLNNLHGEVGVINAKPRARNIFEKKSTLVLANQTWPLVFRAKEGYDDMQSEMFYNLILAIGIIISIAATVLVYQLLTDNRKMLANANAKMHKELGERQKAEEKLAEIEQFAYVASHDLQEPLRTISSYISLLKLELGTNLTEPQTQFMEVISKASNRMRELIKDLLEYSRAGKEQSKVKINCDDMMKELEEDLMMTIKENKAKIIYNQLPEVHGFFTGLKSVFQNLTTNAIKFHKPGVSPTVEIICKEHELEYEFQVKDNGIGIPQKHFNQVFVIFKRLHGTNDYSGTGIGLAQCKKIIELHGGRIWLDSVENAGTIFYFTVPKMLPHLKPSAQKGAKKIAV